jgi:hypothetical protein
VCAADGEANEAVVRVMRFVTSDPPDAVGLFYHAALVERGAYMGRSERLAGAYEATFERTEHEAASLLETTRGVGVALRAELKQGQTTVLIRQYRYEKLPRLCHLHSLYDNPWDL